MSQDGREALLVPKTRANARLGGDDSQPILGELMSVLKSHPRGLRRWSVMRALRENRRRMARDIPHKFEDDVERVFRRFCAETTDGAVRPMENAPFYRPRETAGEVWALNPERAQDASPADEAISPPR